MKKVENKGNGDGEVSTELTRRDTETPPHDPENVHVQAIDKYKYQHDHCNMQHQAAGPDYMT